MRVRRLMRGACALALAAVVPALAGCDAKLPDPESPGAKIYVERCSSGCHRVYAPASMKYEMWKLVVERMQKEHPAKGLPPMTADEERLLLEYLRKHAG